MPGAPALLRVLICAWVLLSPAVASSQTIDFESVPSGSTTDGQPILIDYVVAGWGGVTFSTIDDPTPCEGVPACTQAPRIAKVGPPLTAFQGPLGSFPACTAGATQDDMPSAAAQPLTLCSFLEVRSPTSPAPTCALLVTYVNPSSTLQASGLVLDIDGGEEWTVTAYSGGTPVSGCASPNVGGPCVLEPGAGDGGATAFVIDPPGNQSLNQLIIDYTGSCQSNVGLGFDRFNANASDDFCADGTRIDFEALAHADTANSLHPSHLEDGFRVLPATTASLTTRGELQAIPPYSGSTAINGSNVGGTPIGLMKDSNVFFPEFPPTGALDFPFTAIRVRVTEFDGSVPPGTMVTFNGTKSDNSSVSQSFSLDGNPGPQDFVLAGFDGIKYLDWNSIHQIDDICVVPACGDGLDNDMDGVIDVADQDCDTTRGPSENIPDLIRLPTTSTSPLGFLLAIVAVTGAAAAGLRVRRSGS